MGDHESSYASAASFAPIPWTAAPLRIHPPEPALPLEHPPVPALPLERFPIPALQLDAQGSIQDVNTAAYALFGRTRDALLRHRLSAFLAPSSQTSLKRLLTTIIASGQPGRTELHLLAGDDHTVEVRIDASHDHHGILLVLTDITAYTRAHQCLLDQVAELTQCVQDRDARIGALTRDLSEGGSLMLRQLQLPLSRAADFLDVARRTMGTPPPETGHALQQVEQSVREAQAMMTTVEGYVRRRGERMRLQAVDLGRVMPQVLKAVKPGLAGRQVRFTHDTLPTLTGDSQVFTFLLGELLGNALKFTRTRETACIHVYVREGATEYVLGMCDNGVGFNMRHKDKLFQLFGRLHPRKDFEGAGVGLASVRCAVERFGGRVWAEGKADHGATFWLAWPKVPKIME